MTPYDGDIVEATAAAEDVQTPSERELRRARERLRIEKAALKLLLQRGFDAVTADDIAEAAEISRRTFFRYFPSRDEVLAGVYLRSLSHLFDLLHARPAKESLIEALVNAARLDLLPSEDEDEVEIVDLSRQLIVRHNAAWERAVAQTQAAILDRFTQVVSARLRATGRDPAGARIIAASLWGVSCQVYLQWLKAGYRSNLPDLLLDALRTVRDVLSYEPSQNVKRQNED